MGNNRSQERTIYKDETSTIIGALRTNDDSARFVTQENTQGEYGRFTIDAYGDWSYVLDTSNAIVSALPNGGRLQDSFSVIAKNTIGKILSTYVTVSILGKDYQLKNEKIILLIDDDMTRGVVTEDEVLKAIGKLYTNIEDTQFEVQKRTDGIYGSFSLNEEGFWEYTLDNSKEIVQALGSKDKRVDTFRVSARSPDGQVAFNEVKIIVLGKDEELTADEKPFEFI